MRDALEIFTDEGRIVLQKYEPSCIFCTSIDNIVYYKNKRICNALGELLPQKLVSPVLKISGVSQEKSVNGITKEERARLVATLKEFPLRLRSLRGFEEAIITSGGVDLSQINPKTMESKLVKGLRFCGEVLDVDAFTGGFNMQIAFSTGYLAGNSIED